MQPCPPILFERRSVNTATCCMGRFKGPHTLCGDQGIKASPPTPSVMPASRGGLPPRLNVGILARRVDDLKLGELRQALLGELDSQAGLLGAAERDVWCHV